MARQIRRKFDPEIEKALYQDYADNFADLEDADLQARQILDDLKNMYPAEAGLGSGADPDELDYLYGFDIEIFGFSEDEETIALTEWEESELHIRKSERGWLD